MNKRWLYGAVAGLALIATACANNAAPDTNRGYGTTAQNQVGPRVLNNNDMVGGPAGMYYGTNRVGMRNNAFSGTNYTGTGIAGYNGDNVIGGYRTTGMPRYNAFNGTGTAGIRATDRANYGMNSSIYRDATNRTGMLGTPGSAGVMQTGMSHMGYVKMDRNYLRTNSDSANRVYVDRDALAKVVGNVTASCPGVRTSTVLVTDEEIFVGLNSNGNDAKTTKNQARMNAMSVSPRYFKVYVTDNQQMINQLTRVASRISNVNVAAPQDDRPIDSLIRSFGGLADGDEMRTKGSTMSTERQRANKTKMSSSINNMGTTSR